MINVLKRILKLISGVQKIANNSTKSYLWILFDYLILYKKKRITLEEYFQFEFENRDFDFRESFLGLHEQRFYLDLLNPKKYYILARNKYITHKVLANTGINKSDLICYYNPEGLSALNDEIACDLPDVITILRDKGIKKCVIKTTESSSGKNVLVVNRFTFTESDCILHLFDDTELLLSEFLSKEPLIFEEYIMQTKQLSLLNPSSVNTIRFMTTLYPNGEVRIIGTFIKIGRDGKCVDNAGAGGNVDANINTITGEITYPIQFNGWRNIEKITHHPDNGIRIDGIKIHDWENIKKQVVSFQQSFPFIKAAGWDIAITSKGAVVIEVNDMWDRTGQYFIRKGWRREIRDCYLAWFNTGYTPYFGRLEGSLNEKTLLKIARRN